MYKKSLEVMSAAPPRGMERWRSKVVLITGGSGGLGLVMAKTLANQGMIVYGIARNVQPLKDLAEELGGTCSGAVIALRCDLTIEEEILAVFEQIKKDHGGVDVLINSAGFPGGNGCSLLAGETSKWKTTFDVNVIALLVCSREAIKSMVERNVEEGYVIHMSSIIAHPFPGNDEYLLYTASKMAVNGILDGHRQELSKLPQNIKVSAICPGIVKTEAATILMGGDDYFASVPYILPENIAEAVIALLSMHKDAPIVQLEIRNGKCIM